MEGEAGEGEWRERQRIENGKREEWRNVGNLGELKVLCCPLVGGRLLEVLQALGGVKVIAGDGRC